MAELLQHSGKIANFTDLHRIDSSRSTKAPMINFFRNKRREVVTENRFGKYLIYAVGEIVLVVLGILIALQVNNWNEERRLEKETDNVTQVLNAEFSDNRIVLQERIRDLEKANICVRTVLSFMNKENFEIPKDTNLDSLISKSLKYGNYNPANSSEKEPLDLKPKHMVALLFAD